LSRCIYLLWRRDIVTLVSNIFRLELYIQLTNLLNTMLVTMMYLFLRWKTIRSSPKRKMPCTFIIYTEAHPPDADEKHFQFSNSGICFPITWNCFFFLALHFSLSSLSLSISFALSLSLSLSLSFSRII